MSSGGDSPRFCNYNNRVPFLHPEVPRTFGLTKKCPCSACLGLPQVSPMLKLMVKTHKNCHLKRTSLRNREKRRAEEGAFSLFSSFLFSLLRRDVLFQVAIFVSSNHWFQHGRDLGKSTQSQVIARSLRPK